MKKYDFRTAYIDLLLNVLTTILAMFIVSTLIIQPPVKKEHEGIKKDAQLVMNINWDDNTDCDVDIWAEDPKGNIVSFQNKSNGLMHIERDDLGFRGDMLDQQIGRVPDSDQKNTETWVLRGKIAGQFTINLHLYACRINGVQLDIGSAVDIPVTYELIKLNPDYRIVRKEVVDLTEVWEEKNLFVFTMDANGNVIGFKNTERSLIQVSK